MTVGAVPKIHHMYPVATNVTCMYDRSRHSVSPNLSLHFTPVPEVHRTLAQPCVSCAL